jgi:hypothetical protein
MRHIVIALATFAIPLPAAAQALKGVWKPVDVILTSGGTSARSQAEVAGLIILTDNHYSVTLEALGSAGTYEVTDVALVLMPSVVSAGAAAASGTQALPIRLVADTLWLTATKWYGNGVEAQIKLVRVSGAPVVAAKGGKTAKVEPPAADNASMIVGSWVLNEQKSEFSPGRAPRTRQVTYERTAAGVRFVATTVDVAGNTIQEEWTGIEDGRDFPYKGSRDFDTQSIRITGKLRAEIITKRAGRIAMGGTRVLASNGKTMTITLNGTGADGQVIKEVMIFDRQS